MRGLALVATTALTVLGGSACAMPPGNEPDPRARELAQALATEDGIPARLSKLDTLDSVLMRQIARALDVSDPGTNDKIAAVVRKRTHAIEDELIETNISAMARIFTVPELEGALSFGRSPTGQALRSASPELDRELASVMLSKDAPAEGAPLSERKAALIDRILKAQGIEGGARKAWRAIGAITAKVFADEPGSKVSPLSDDRAEDAYARRTVAAETRFYAKTFSDEQLMELAAYFDGPIGRAFAAGAPRLMSAVAGEGPAIFERQFERMDQEVCAAVACTTSQRAALDAQLAKDRSMIAPAISAVSH